MKYFYKVLLITVFSIFNNITYSQTYSGNVSLTTQTEVNDFGANGYTAVTGNLSIDGSDITDITSLSTITSVGGRLSIGSVLGGNPNLSSLEGLHNILDVGDGLRVAKNSSLTNAEGLRSIVTVGNYISILENNVLSNLDGLRSITSVGNSAPVGEGNLTVRANPSLTNLNGLGNITSLSSNGFVKIEDNTSLNSFCGLYGIFTSSWSGNYYVSGNLTNPTKQDVIDGGPCSTLPVELTTFTATINRNIVELNWETATEVNNYGFEIEKHASTSLSMTDDFITSGDEGWEKLAFVEGHGNSNSPKFYTYLDKSVSFGKYNYRLKQIDIDGQFEYSDVVEVDLGLPSEFTLSQNYPNPFNPTTTIAYTIPFNVKMQNVASQHVQLKVYDVLGREVATLVNKKQSAGNYKVNFDASTLSSGVYYYKLTAGSFVQTKKMLMMK